MAGKNRNHYFRVKPGDDARLFQDVDVETEGFIARMRRVAHDCTPYGFLVDVRKRPYDAKKIADIARLTNQRTTVILGEARASQLLQSPAEFRADLLRATQTQLSRKKLEIFDAMCSEIQAAGWAIGDVLLVPTILEDHLATETGSKFGKHGGNPVITLVRETGSDPLTPPLNPPPKGGDLTGGVNTQKSEVIVRDQRSESTSGSPSRVGERESLPPRARGGDDEKPMPWRVFTARSHEISRWQASLGTVSPDRFEADFEAKFQMTWPSWAEIKRLMELSIPKPCHDGNHVFDGLFCIYCPYIRVAEETA